MSICILHKHDFLNYPKLSENMFSLCSFDKKITFSTIFLSTIFESNLFTFCKKCLNMIIGRDKTQRR